MHSKIRAHKQASVIRGPCAISKSPLNPLRAAMVEPICDDCGGRFKALRRLNDKRLCLCCRAQYI